MEEKEARVNILSQYFNWHDDYVAPKIKAKARNSGVTIDRFTRCLTSVILSITERLI